MASRPVPAPGFGLRALSWSTLPACRAAISASGSGQGCARPARRNRSRPPSPPSARLWSVIPGTVFTSMTGLTLAIHQDVTDPPVAPTASEGTQGERLQLALGRLVRPRAPGSGYRWRGTWRRSRKTRAVFPADQRQWLTSQDRRGELGAADPALGHDVAVVFRCQLPGGAQLASGRRLSTCRCSNLRAPA